MISFCYKLKIVVHLVLVQNGYKHCIENERTFQTQQILNDFISLKNDFTDIIPAR